LSIRQLFVQFFYACRQEKISIPQSNSCMNPERNLDKRVSHPEAGESINQNHLRLALCLTEANSKFPQHTPNHYRHSPVGLLAITEMIANNVPFASLDDFSPTAAIIAFVEPKINADHQAHDIPVVFRRQKLPTPQDLNTGVYIHATEELPRHYRNAANYTLQTLLGIMNVFFPDHQCRNGKNVDDFFADPNTDLLKAQQFIDKLLETSAVLEALGKNIQRAYCGFNDYTDKHTALRFAEIGELKVELFQK
jgi:hypothetical protein